MKKIEISFITINYNSSLLTINLIKSILEKTTDDISFEIIVVDNASLPSEVNLLERYILQYTQVKLVKNRINSGFASGNMLGVNYAQGDYYFFINNDCLLLNNVSLIFKQFLDKNCDVSLVSGKVLDENKNFRSSYKQFPHLVKQIFGNSIQRVISNNKFPSNKVNLTSNTPVEVVSGACMFFRAIDFNHIGGFDTIFFLYCEEEDICKRIWNINKKVYFIPEAEIYHKSGGSSSSKLDLEKEFYLSYDYLIKKHFNSLEVIVLKLSLFIKLFFRIFKRKNGIKIFLFFLFSLKMSNGLRHKQTLSIRCREV